MSLLPIEPSPPPSLSLAVAGSTNSPASSACCCPLPPRSSPLGGKLIHPLENKLQVAFRMFSSLSRAAAVGAGCVCAGCVCLTRIFNNLTITYMYAYL